MPTGTTSPGSALSDSRIPDAGASISTVTLSVSISISGSPSATRAPSGLSHCSNVADSWSISIAGMTTSYATAYLTQAMRSSTDFTT